MPEILGGYTHTDLTHCQELMKSLGSYGNLSLLFMTKVMV
jgi:hypothetical protein